MITQLQNFFLKHNKWLFGSLLVVIIVTFVLTIGPQSMFDGPSGQTRQKLEFFGYDLTSQGQQQVMFRNAELSMALNPELGIQREQLTDYAYLRIAGLGMASRIGIPNPEREALQNYLKTLSLFQDPVTQEFSAEQYNNILDVIESGGRFSRAMLAEVLREDYRITMVRQALGGPDYSLPYEIERDFIDRESTYTFVLAHFPESNFTPEIEVSEADLESFYNENPSRYEISEKINVTALHFNVDAYMDETSEPSEDAIVAYFENNRSRWEGEPNEAGEVEEVNLEDVRLPIVTDLKRQESMKLAAEKGAAFTLQLWREKVELNSPQYNELLDAYRIRTNEVEPYARDAAPRMGNVPQDLLNSMWIYTGTSNRYFSDVATTATGAVVIVVDSLTEARQPPFSEVRDQVESDFRSAERRRLFAEYGNELHNILAENPQDFISIAESLEMQIEEQIPFNGADIPFTLRFHGIWEQIQYLPEGQVSQMIINNQRGTFAFLQEKVVPEVDRENAAFAEFEDQRSVAVASAMGWSRLREITDTNLERVLGPTE